MATTFFRIPPDPSITAPVCLVLVCLERPRMFQIIMVFVGVFLLMLL